MKTAAPPARSETIPDLSASARTATARSRRSPKSEVGPEAGPTAEILSLRAFIEDGGARLRQLLSRLSAQGMGVFRFPKVHHSEISQELLETLGFRSAGGHRLYAARARSG